MLISKLIYDDIVRQIVVIEEYGNAFKLDFSPYFAKTTVLEKKAQEKKTALKRKQRRETY